MSLDLSFNSILPKILVKCKRNVRVMYDTNIVVVIWIVITMTVIGS